MSDVVTRYSNGTWVRVRNAEAVRAGRATKTDAPDATPAQPYTVAITMRDPPYHGIIATLHDKPPTPQEGGGGWEEVQLPKRGSVLIWRGRGLMKMTLSVVFDGFAAGTPVIDDTFQTLLHFWRPEGTAAADDSTVEPAVLRLSAKGHVVPYRNLSWVIDDLEWGDAQGDDGGERTQQVMTITFKEHRADERIKPQRAKKSKKSKTKPYTWKRGDTLASVAEKHHTTAAKLGAMQKPPVKDGRGYKPGHKIVVPA